MTPHEQEIYSLVRKHQEEMESKDASKAMWIWALVMIICFLLSALSTPYTYMD